MTHFRAAFPQHVEFVEEPCQADYLDAAECFLEAYRLSRREVFLYRAEAFERVARRYNWLPGKHASEHLPKSEPARGQAGQK